MKPYEVPTATDLDRSASKRWLLMLSTLTLSGCAAGYGCLGGAFTGAGIGAISAGATSGSISVEDRGEYAASMIVGSTMIGAACGCVGGAIASGVERGEARPRAQGHEVR